MPRPFTRQDYTFLPTDAGTHVFSFTFKTLGDQTITVTDTHSAGFTGTATINVNTTPDLTISKSHTGNFSVGQTGAAYTITISNAGHGPTSWDRDGDGCSAQRTYRHGNQRYWVELHPGNPERAHW